MLFGIAAGVLWALATVTLGYALTMSPFVSTEQAVFLAPFVSTFLHDSFSALWMILFNTGRGRIKDAFKSYATKSGRTVMLAGLVGGPVGMTGYCLAVNNMGASVGAVASAVFPAIGAILAHIFLKEKMKWYRWIFLCLTLAGVYGLSYSPSTAVKSFPLGLLGVVMCSVGWGVEAVILAKSLKGEGMRDEYALQIRQSVSALVYGVILLPILRGWGFTVKLFTDSTGWLLPCIALAGLFAASSYMCYYNAIRRIGASKAMALDVTYAAWALILGCVVYRDFSTLTPLTVGCTVVVLVCSVLSTADFAELKKKSGNE